MSLASGSGTPSEPRLRQSEPVPPFPQVFAEYADMVWRVLRGMGVTAHQVDDAAQDVFVVVHNRLHEFEGRSKLSTWIYGIAHRVALGYRRKTVREHQLGELSPELPCAGINPEQSTAASQQALLVERFCLGLDEGMRDVFVLCFLEEATPQEVATLLELSPNTVYSRIRLLRGAFRVALEEYHQPRSAS